MNGHVVTSILLNRRLDSHRFNLKPELLFNNTDSVAPAPTFGWSTESITCHHMHGDVTKTLRRRKCNPIALLVRLRRTSAFGLNCLREQAFRTFDIREPNALAHPYIMERDLFLPP